MLNQNLIKKLTVLCAVTLTAVSAHGYENNKTVDLIVGSTTQEVEGNSGDDLSLGLRGAFGVNEHVAIEASYIRYGEADYSYIDSFSDTINEKADTSAFNIGVRGSLPLDNGFSVHARIGLSLWDTDIQITDSSLPGQVFKGGDSGNDIYYGIGARYALNEKVDLGLEYTIAKYDTALDGDLRGLDAKLELETVALAIGFKF